jgi:uncharacterized protein
MSSRPPARRRVSPQRYLVRRVVVGTVLGVALLGVLRVMGGMLGSEDGAASAPDSITIGDPATIADADADADADAGSDADADAGAVGDDGAVGDAAGAAAVPVGAAAPSGPPTPDDPARVLIVGDSDAGTFGPYLQQLLGETQVVETVLDYKVSSGLARPDFFDWHRELETKVPEVDPDIVVVTFGGNDGQFLADPSGGRWSARRAPTPTTPSGPPSTATGSDGSSSTSTPMAAR